MPLIENPNSIREGAANYFELPLVSEETPPTNRLIEACSR